MSSSADDGPMDVVENEEEADPSPATHVPTASEMASLQRAVVSNPRDYGAHVSLIEAMRALGADTTATREAREAFAAAHPLSPQLWAEWIEDELKANKLGRAGVRMLYERAFEDYQCAPLWPAYLNLLEEMYDDGELSLEDLRAAFERALTAAGVHVVRAEAIWKKYRHFERDQFEESREESAAGEEEAGSGGGDVTAKELRTAEARLRRIYRRQLALPLIGNEEALSEYLDLFSGDDRGAAGGGGSTSAEAEARAVLEVYKKGQAALAQRLPFERDIAAMQEADEAAGCAAGGNDALAKAWELWRAYVEWEEKQKDEPARAHSLLERALAEGCCLLESAWVKLGDLVGLKLGNKGAEAKAMARAVRNLPWSHDLWCRHLRAAVAAGGASSATASAQAAQAAVEGRQLASAEGCIKVLLGVCEAARRAVVAAADAAPAGPAGLGAVAASVGKMRTAYARAEEFLLKNYPDWQEGWLAVTRHRSAVEDELVGEFDEPARGLESRARESWERLVRRFPTSAVPWMEYAMFERANSKDVAACRAIYAKAVPAVHDYPASVADAWLRLESEMGSLDDYNNARRKIAAAEAALGRSAGAAPAAKSNHANAATAAARSSNAGRERSGQKAQGERSRGRGRDTGKGDGGGGDGGGGSGGSRGGNANGGGGGKKMNGRERNENGEEQAGRLQKKARMEAAATEITPPPRSTRPPSTTVQSDGKGSGAPMQPLAATAAAAKADATSPGTGPAGAAQPHGGHEEEKMKEAECEGGGGNVLYLTNLSFAANEAAVRAVLQESGGVESITIPRKGGSAEGRSRGVAFVRMADEKAVERAIGHAQLGMQVCGRPITASKWTKPIPQSKPPKKAAAAPAGLAAVASGGAAAAASGNGSGGAPQWPVHPTTVFVTGLPEIATEEQLARVFGECGTVAVARVVLDKTSGRRKGTALVQFEDAAAVERALALAGSNQLGGTLGVMRSRFPAMKPVLGGGGVGGDGGHGGRGSGGEDSGDRDGRGEASGRAGGAGG
ncbi:unnamed protein product, partial [Phaeothamnion confervicola]